MDLVSAEFSQENVSLIATRKKNVQVFATDIAQSTCLDANFPHGAREGLFEGFDMPHAERDVVRISFRPELLVHALKYNVKKSDSVEIVVSTHGNAAGAPSTAHLYVYIQRCTTTATKISTHQIPLMEVLDDGEEFRIDPERFTFTHQMFTEHASVMLDILSELKHADVDDVAVTIDGSGVCFEGLSPSHFNRLSIRLEDLTARARRADGDNFGRGDDYGAALDVDGGALTGSSTVSVLCEPEEGCPEHHTEKFRRKFLHRLSPFGSVATSVLVQMGRGAPLSVIVTIRGGGTCQLFVAPMLRDDDDEDSQQQPPPPPSSSGRHLLLLGGDDDDGGENDNPPTEHHTGRLLPPTQPWTTTTTTSEAMTMNRIPEDDDEYLDFYLADDDDDDDDDEDSQQQLLLEMSMVTDLLQHGDVSFPYSHNNNQPEGEEEEDDDDDDGSSSVQNRVRALVLQHIKHSLKQRAICMAQIGREPRTTIPPPLMRTYADLDANQQPVPLTSALRFAALSTSKSNPLYVRTLVVIVAANNLIRSNSTMTIRRLYYFLKTLAPVDCIKALASSATVESDARLSDRIRECFLKPSSSSSNNNNNSSSCNLEAAAASPPPQTTPLFPKVNFVFSAVKSACALLKCRRMDLRLCCSSKGSYAGCLVVHTARGAKLDGTTTGKGGISIPGDISEIAEMEVTCKSQFVIIVEKDAVFQQLVEQRVWERIEGGCVVVTARGMPDLATRAFCFHLRAEMGACMAESLLMDSDEKAVDYFAANAVVFLGLVDWNPAGLAIAMTYKYGGVHGDRRRTGQAPTGQEYTQESAQYALGSNFKLLGLRECHLDKLQADSTTAIAFQPLTPRDETMLSTFVDCAWLVALPENYTILSEAKAMRRRKGKAELEVVPDLATFVASEVEYGEYDDY